MRRVGTLTSAFTMLLLGFLLLADVIWNRSFFVSGLNFWPVILVGLGIEILASWMYIRRKHLSESIRLDGRSLALLFLVGVFSVNFYLSTIQTVKGAEETPAPKETLFTVNKKEIALPQQDVNLTKGIKQIVIQNPLGDINVVGSSDAMMHVLSQVHLFSTPSSSAEHEASQLSPYITLGQSTLVAVHLDQNQTDVPVTAPGTVDLQVQVPNGYELVVRGDHGDVNISRYRGNVRTEAKSGAITLENLTGTVTANDQNGAITVSKINGNVDLTSDQRGVTASEITGKLVVHSQAGPCTISRIHGALDLIANNGEVDLDTIEGDIVAFSTSGLLTVKNAQASVMGTVTNGDIKMASKVLGDWTLLSTNGTVRMTIPKDSSIQFTGVTNKGVIKGPTKQSPSGGTKPGAYLTDRLGDGLFPVMVRSDNGSIFVDVQ